MAAMIMVSSAGYGVMFTVLDDIRDQFGVSESHLGLIVAIGFFASFLAQVLLAPLADRGHARRLLMAGLALQAVGMSVMALGHSVLPFVIARAVMGIGAGMMNPAARRIVVLADPAQLGRNIGRLLAADVVGFAVGPAVSAVLVGPFGIAAPFWVMAAVTCIGFPFALRVHITEQSRDDVVGGRFAFDLLRDRAYLATVCFGVAVFLMIGTFDVLWVLVLDDLRAADWIANLGIVLFAVPLALLGPFGGRLSQHHGPFRVGTIGLLVGAACMTSYGYWPSAGVMFAAAMLHAVNDGLTVSSTGVAVAMVAPHQRQAGAQGLMGGVQTLVGGLTAMAAGSLYDGSGRRVAYTVTGIAMTTAVGTGLVLLGPRWRDRPGQASDTSSSQSSEK
jgi:MFS family permease